MVSPQSRIPVRRPSGRAFLLIARLGIVAAVLAMMVGALFLMPLKRGVDWARGYPAWHRRAALEREPAPFGRIAASQLGYGPSMVKQFSSPRRFASFQIVSASGEAAFQGGPPVREVPTDTLGAIHTVWVGDFTALTTPGRYRIIADNNISSYSFDISAGVFDQ